MSIDKDRDLTLDRVIDAPVALVWRAWTEAALLQQWFTPKPWRIPRCEADARPGGRLYVEMRGPNEGEQSIIDGCYLEIVPQQRLSWTDALSAGYRPKAESFITAVITFTPDGARTRLHAHVLHADSETRARHEAMGFFDGWNAVLNQMQTLVQELKR